LAAAILETNLSKTMKMQDCIMQDEYRGISTELKKPTKSQNNNRIMTTHNELRRGIRK